MELTLTFGISDDSVPAITIGSAVASGMIRTTGLAANARSSNSCTIDSIRWNNESLQETIRWLV